MAVAFLLDLDWWHVVAASRRLQSVTADFVVLHHHCPTGVAQEGVAAVLQQPRLTRLQKKERERDDSFE